MRGDEEDRPIKVSGLRPESSLNKMRRFRNIYLNQKKKENLQTYCTSKDFIKAINEERK